MKSRLFLLFLPIFLVSSCMPNSKKLPMQTPSTTQDPYAGLSTAVTLTDTEMYSGPGNSDYAIIYSLSAGEEIKLLGIYNDFIKVYDPRSQTMGYVWKAALKNVPLNLKSIDITDVPLIEEDFIQRNCKGPFTTISPDGKAIIHDYTQGPGGYQLQGAPISLNSTTRVTIQMETDNGKTTWIGFSDMPFRTYGDWFLGYRKVTIFKNYAGFSGYSIEFRDGKKPDAITIPLTKLKNDPFDLLFLDSFGKKIQIIDKFGNILYDFSIPGINFDGTSLTLPDGLYPNQTMYVECASDGPTSVTLASHRMTRTPTGIWVTKNQLPHLRELGKQHGIEMILPSEGWRMGDERFATIINQQSSMEYLVSELSPPNFWLGKGLYNFDYLDHLMSSIINNNQKIMAAIVYGPEPGSIPEDIRNGNFTKEEYTEILHDYVNTVVCRYKDKVSIWMIANESVGARAMNAYDFWADKIGWEYVDLSFQWARECDPDGILLLNDSINDSRRDSYTTIYVDAMLKKIKDMKSRGIPIDAVGIQGHFFLPWNSMVPPTKEGVIQTMREFAALGVDVYITELDVNLSRINNTQEEKWAYQATIYKIMMDACLESGVCKGFGVFGVNDDHSFGMCLSSDQCPPAILPEPLWFDVNYNPKPAFYSVLESLQTH